MGRVSKGGQCARRLLPMLRDDRKRGLLSMRPGGVRLDRSRARC